MQVSRPKLQLSVLTVSQAGDSARALTHRDKVKSGQRFEWGEGGSEGKTQGLAAVPFISEPEVP